MKQISMRDAFFTRLYELAVENRNIIVVSADMGAPALDKFRNNLGKQYINVGIAEQNMVTLASGLALSGKKVFMYAIMPFISSRCYEITKVCLSLMKIPVVAVGVGSGFSYDDSGPTHHSTEDITIMRVLPDMTVFNSTDSVMAKQFADIACNLAAPCYIRLDREVLPDIYGAKEDFSHGLSVLKKGAGGAIISTGNMVHKAMEITQVLEKSLGEITVVDLYRLKPVNTAKLLRIVSQKKWVVTMEEHLLAGGLGSLIAEIFADKNIKTPLKRIGLKDSYYYAYGGRQNIQKICGLDNESISKTIKGWCKKCVKL